MPKLSLEEIKEIPRSKLLELINKVKDRIKHHETVKKLFDEYDVDIDMIDLIPVAFADLEVSARTDHAVIYLNYSLLEDGDLEMDDHYLVHEITHFLQQTQGDGPTKGAAEGDYLENEFEQEGFQTQTEYLSDTRGDDFAKDYIEQVLDHHEVEDPKDRMEKRKDLLHLAMRS